MRIRAEDAGGDYTFGKSGANFLIDSSEAVALLARNTLGLWRGDWFLDTVAGTPWPQGVLGRREKQTADLEIQDTLLGVQGVTSISSYSSMYDKASREYFIYSEIATVYGPATIATSQ